MNKLKKSICGILAAATLAGCSGPELEGGAAMLQKNISIRDYAISDVSMTDAYCTNAFEKEIEYLLSLEPDRLLSNFRKNRGLDTNGVEPYNGWENTLIGGHTMGHYLTALAQAATNDAVSSSDREKLYERMTLLIDELAKCQHNDGFLWGSQVLDLANVDAQFDNVELGKADMFKEAWVPWYTTHKIFEGLISSYELTGYEPALDIAKKLGDWVYNRVTGWSEETRRTVLSIEYGGMNDALYDLYRLTGDDKYAVAAHAFDEDSLFELIRTDGANVLNNRHANTTIPKIIGALNRYIVLDGKTVNGEKVDASEYLETAEIFWQMVIDHHTYATGGNSEWEHFGEDDVLNRERTNCNCETCNVYNMLKLTKNLFMVTGDVKYADYYENAFINHILASQNPETGMTTYFQAMSTGYFRTFSTPVDSFWCCTGTGMENFTKLGDGMYFYDEDSLYVNMYFSSELDAENLGLKLTQESNIPLTDKATLKLKLSESKEFSLMLRIPSWAKSDVTVSVNGETVQYENAEGYAKITREWKNGDTVEITIPLGLTAENVIIPETTIISDDTLTLKDGITPTAVKQNPGEYFTDNGNLSFTFTANDQELEFVPYYSLYNTRYGIYWKLAEAE